MMDATALNGLHGVISLAQAISAPDHPQRVVMLMGWMGGDNISKTIRVYAEQERYGDQLLGIVPASQVIGFIPTEPK